MHAGNLKLFFKITTPCIVIRPIRQLQLGYFVDYFNSAIFHRPFHKLQEMKHLKGRIITISGSRFICISYLFLVSCYVFICSLVLSSSTVYSTSSTSDPHMNRSNSLTLAPEWLIYFSFCAQARQTPGTAC